MSQPTRTALYRHFNADGVLLYVGISLNPFRRLQQHEKSSHWFWKVARVDIEWHETRESAEAAEVAAIRKEDPLWNTKGGYSYEYVLLPRLTPPEDARRG